YRVDGEGNIRDGARSRRGSLRVQLGQFGRAVPGWRHDNAECRPRPEHLPDHHVGAQTRLGGGNGGARPQRAPTPAALVRDASVARRTRAGEGSASTASSPGTHNKLSRRSCKKYALLHVTTG